MVSVVPGDVLLGDGVLGGLFVFIRIPLRMGSRELGGELILRLRMRNVVGKRFED